MEIGQRHVSDIVCAAVLYFTVLIKCDTKESFSGCHWAVPFPLNALTTILPDTKLPTCKVLNFLKKIYIPDGQVITMSYKVL